MPLHIRFDKTDRFISVYFRTRYFVLFGREKYDSIYDKIRHLINVKGDITYINSHNYETIKVASYNPLPIVKAMTICNAIIFFNSVWNKGKNNYWYKKLCSCKNKN